MTRPVRAARLRRHGEAPQVEIVELPDPGPGEVLVELAFAGVNPVDRYGVLGSVAPDGPMPRTLGSEASGTLDGEPVVVVGHGFGASRDGLWAEAAVVPRDAVVAVPPEVPLQQAAAMGVAGRTAFRTAVELGQLGPGDRVLVFGASGGVGSMVVSLAHRLGAVVWAQTGESTKSAWLAERGADEVVVARSGEELAAGPARGLSPSLVVDSLGGSFTAAAVELLERGGRIVLYGTSAGATGELPLQALYRKSARILGYGGLGEAPAAVRTGVQAALGEVAAGRLEVVVDEVLPLAEVAEALERLTRRDVRGKLLLDLGS